MALAKRVRHTLFRTVLMGTGTTMRFSSIGKRLSPTPNTRRKSEKVCMAKEPGGAEWMENY